MSNGMLAGGRTARLAALTRVHFRRPDDFVGLPDTTGKRWYVIKTNPQSEAKAEESIRRIGFDTYTPVLRKRLYDSRTKKRIHKTSPVFVGYVFVLLPECAPDIGLIRECDGVRDFLPIWEGCPPISFSDAEIEALRREEASQWLTQDREFRGRRRPFSAAGKGVSRDRHIIPTGAFEGFLAAIQRVEGEKPRVLTQSAGSFVEIDVTLDDLLRAA